MKLGFIGTGALASAIVTGLKSLADDDLSILLSPRNERTAASLASRCSGVRIAADNQAVLDGSGIVMLAVRPQVAREVLSELAFRPNHHVISLFGTLSRETVVPLTAPAGRVTRALPIPMVAQRQGATLVYPPDPLVSSLFGRLGKVIEVEDPAEFDALATATATFATYFRYLDTIQTWLQWHGVEHTRARDYVASLYKALGNAPESAPNTDFMHLSQEYATRGGTNEQVLRELNERHLFNAISEGLDGVHRRIRASSS
jgi:pyrroline-5-carboxylate reductase